MRRHPGWVRIYRAVNHGQAEQACRSREVRSLPDGVQNFAKLFVGLQEQRHRADYDPHASFNKSEVERLIVDARAVLDEFEQADRLARRYLAVLVLFRRRN